MAVSISSERIPQSVTVRVPIYAVLAADHATPATGKTIAITISKNGAAFGNPSGGATNATEIGLGWYYVDLSATDTGTLGPLLVSGSVALIDDTVNAYDVVSALNAGLANLDVAVSTRLISGSVTVGTNTDKTGYALSASQTFDLTGNITGNLIGDVTGSVGSAGVIMGDIGGDILGNVVGSVQSVLDTVITTAVRGWPAP